MENLAKLSKTERKKLARMDFIERIIRIEQGVNASFGKNIPYKETEFFKSLSPTEKEKFENYLKRKKRKKRILLSAIFLMLLMIIIIPNLNKITGKYIYESFENTEKEKAEKGILNYNIFRILVLGFILSVFVFLVISLREIRNLRIVNREIDFFNKVIEKIRNRLREDNYVKT